MDNQITKNLFDTHVENILRFDYIPRYFNVEVIRICRFDAKN